MDVVGVDVWSVEEPRAAPDDDLFDVRAHQPKKPRKDNIFSPNVYF